MATYRQRLCRPVLPLMVLILIHQTVSTSLCSEPGTPCTFTCDDTHECYAMDMNVSLSSSVLFNCSGDYSCQHLNVKASDIDTNSDDQHTNVTIICSGSQSCMFATIDLPDTNALSLNCMHPDSCIDTSVTMTSSPASSIAINLFDSCSTFLSIRCLDEASLCGVYCEDKCVRIAAEAFQVTTLTETCFEQQFSDSCRVHAAATRTGCETGDGVNTALMTQTVWDIQQRVNESAHDDCSRYYHGEFHKVATSVNPSYDMLQHENATIRVMSVMLAVCVACVALLIVIAMVHRACHNVYRVWRKQYISNRPPSFLLWSFFLFDALIIIAFYWWFIKGCMFQLSINSYCESNYPVNEQSQFRVTCADDDLCHLDEDCDEDDNGSCTYECTSELSNLPEPGYMLFICFVLDGIRIMLMVCADSCSSECSGVSGCGSECVCCMIVPLVCCWTDFETYSNYVTKEFWKRELWPRVPEDDKCCASLRCGCDVLLRYFGFLFVWLHFGQYSPLLPDTDAALKWYDLWSVLVLIGLKHGLLIYYLCGQPYDPKQDRPYHIREILVQKLAHSSVAAVVESYLPLFHDVGACPPELLTIKIDKRTRSLIKTNSTYERFE